MATSAPANIVSPWSLTAPPRSAPLRPAPLRPAPLRSAPPLLTTGHAGSASGGEASYFVVY